MYFCLVEKKNKINKKEICLKKCQAPFSTLGDYDFFFHVSFFFFNIHPLFGSGKLRCTEPQLDSHYIFGASYFSEGGISVEIMLNENKHEKLHFILFLFYFIFMLCTSCTWKCSSKRCVLMHFICFL